MHIRNKTPMIVNSKINDRRKEQALEGWMTKQTGTYTHKKVQMKHGKVKETYNIGRAWWCAHGVLRMFKSLHKWSTIGVIISSNAYIKYIVNMWLNGVWM